MRTAGNIRQKLKQVKYRHLQKLLGKRLSHHPANCAHNAEVEIPDNGTSHDPVHICTYQGDEEVPGGVNTVCDAKHKGIERARACPCFQPKKTKDEIKAEFKDFFDTASHGEIAYLYPDAAALMWTLDGDFDEADEDTEEEPVQAEPAAELPQPPPVETVEALDPEGEGSTPEEALLGEVRTLLTTEIERASDVLRQAIDAKFDALPSKEDREAEIRQVVESVQPPAPPVPTSWWSRLFGAR